MIWFKKKKSSWPWNVLHHYTNEKKLLILRKTDLFIQLLYTAFFFFFFRSFNPFRDTYFTMYLDETPCTSVYWYTRTNEYKRNNIRSQTKDWRVFRKYCSKCTAAGSMRTRAYGYCDGLGNMQRDYKVLHNAPSGRNDITTRHTTYTHISTWFTRRFYSVFYAFGPCRSLSLSLSAFFFFFPVHHSVLRFV